MSDCMWFSLNPAIVYENVAVIRDEVSLLKAKILDSNKKWDYLVEKVETRLSQTAFDNSFTMFCEWWWQYNLNAEYQKIFNLYFSTANILKALFPDYSYTNVKYSDCSYLVTEFDYYFDGMDYYVDVAQFSDRRDSIADVLIEEFSGYYDYCYFWLKFYFCIPLRISDNFSKSLFEIVEKNLHLTNSLNFKQDANLKHTHSKSFVKFLNQKVKDNSDALLSKLNLSDFVSSAQTELDLPSSSSSALSLYNAVLNSVDWWTDLLNLFIDFVNNLEEYNQNSKIDRILECNFDVKKFNRLLGDALNYAREFNGEGEVPDYPVVKRNDKVYIDESPDGQVSLDWDGGLPAIFNHRHYDFSSVLSFPVYIANQSEPGKEWISRYIVNSFYHDHWSGGEIYDR